MSPSMTMGPKKRLIRFSFEAISTAALRTLASLAKLTVLTVIKAITKRAMKFSLAPCISQPPSCSFSRSRLAFELYIPAQHFDVLGFFRQLLSR